MSIAICTKLLISFYFFGDWMIREVSLETCLLYLIVWNSFSELHD